MRATQTINTNDTLQINGLEIAIQQNLDFLPAPWSGFGGIINYSKVDTDDKENILPGIVLFRQVRIRTAFYHIVNRIKLDIKFQGQMFIDYFFNKRLPGFLAGIISYLCSHVRIFIL